MFSTQVLRVFYRINNVNTIARYKHSDKFAKVLVPLQSRKLLKIDGKDAPEFLQGLITNDIRHLVEGSRSMYALFLNNKGRILYDSLIHKWSGNDAYLIECDRGVYGQLHEHLNRYKLRRAINVENMNNDYRLWALLSPTLFVPELTLDVTSPINIFKDPRLQELGCRVLSKAKLGANDVIKLLGQEVLEGEPDVYRYVRYKLGVAEGPEDLPPGECFPLEANCDFLHGVSFQKGCYIGQELTARVHHTGVVRKRLMPLKFDDVVSDYLQRDTVIKAANDVKSNLGKLKGFVHDYGLGLVRIKEALESKELLIEEKKAEVIKPDWWPIEAPKEKPQIQKTD